jgi:septal ring factor EnvC (AmiA/AmiB activator)
MFSITNNEHVPTEQTPKKYTRDKTTAFSRADMLKNDTASVKTELHKKKVQVLDEGRKKMNAIRNKHVEFDNTVKKLSQWEPKVQQGLTKVNIESDIKRMKKMSKDIAKGMVAVEGTVTEMTDAIDDIMKKIEEIETTINKLEMGILKDAFTMSKKIQILQSNGNGPGKVFHYREEDISDPMRIVRDHRHSDLREPVHDQGTQGEEALFYS